MSLWDKIITQNRIDSSLLTELSDISYKNTKGKREKPRNFKEGIVDLGKIPFEVNPPKDQITKEMIEDYHKSQLQPLKDPVTGATIPNKFYPSNYQYEVADLQTPYAPVNFTAIGRPANQANIDLYNRQLIKTATDLDFHRCPVFFFCKIQSFKSHPIPETYFLHSYHFIYLI